MKPVDTKRTPDWLLERIALGELPPAQLQAARARLLSEPDGPARLAELEADNAATLARHRPEDVAAEVQRRTHLAQVREAHAAPKKAAPLWLGVPVAAALAVLLIVTARPEQPSPLTEGGTVLVTDYTGIKGDARLVVHRKGTGAEPQLLDDASTARPGDVLQLSYLPAEQRYGAILSVDGRGAVTLHLPETGEQAVALDAKGAALPHSYELDDAPAFERFVFVTSKKPFALGPVREALRRAAASPQAPLQLPAGLQADTLLLRKSVP